MKSFINFSKILGVEAKIVRHALNSQMKDFEDAIQTETAIQNNIKVIITRDKCGFEGSALEIFTPIEYIEELNKIR